MLQEALRGSPAQTTTFPVRPKLSIRCALPRGPAPRGPAPRGLAGLHQTDLNQTGLHQTGLHANGERVIMSKRTSRSYDPRSYETLTFHDATQRFREGGDTPRAYLERCLATLAEREPVVKAFAALNETPAREAADASSARWKAGSPHSVIDGMPIAIKDLLETKDMPTQMGCEAYRGNFSRRDNAAVWALREAGAVVLGKTVTAELGGAEPGATTNPFDHTRTPGGSSSGSAAAVAAPSSCWPRPRPCRSQTIARL
jgi:hypothetical protein